jgi:hypothetical protein
MMMTPYQSMTSQSKMTSHLVDDYFITCKRYILIFCHKFKNSSSCLRFFTSLSDAFHIFVEKTYGTVTIMIKINYVTVSSDVTVDLKLQMYMAYLWL